MRATVHNGRTRKNGTPYNAGHNDRTAGVGDNVDPAKTKYNRYWSVASGGWYGEAEQSKFPAFPEAEADFYASYFMPMYNAAKSRSEARGQGKRVKPFDEWRQCRQYCPEETYVQAGKIGETVDNNTFRACAREFLSLVSMWTRQHGAPFRTLDIAYHYDETCPQLHIRRVWMSRNPKTGILEIGQEKALERAGVPLPDPAEPVGRYNNRKITFDRIIRGYWLDACERHGVPVERDPIRGAPHNMSKTELIDCKARELEARERALDAMEREKLEELAARERALENRERGLAAGERALEAEAGRMARELDDRERALAVRESNQAERDTVTRSIAAGLRRDLDARDALACGELCRELMEGAGLAARAAYVDAAREYARRPAAPMPAGAGAARLCLDDCGPDFCGGL